MTAFVAPVATPSVRRRWRESVLGLVAGDRLRRTPSDLATDLIDGLAGHAAVDES